MNPKADFVKIDNIKTPSTVWATEKRRAAYRTGHGDLVFGRLCEEKGELQDECGPISYYAEDGPVKELDDFRRWLSLFVPSDMRKADKCKRCKGFNYMGLFLKFVSAS